MTRQELLQLLAGAPLAAVSGRSVPPADDGEVHLHLVPGTHMTGKRSAISVSGHGVRIEGCSFEGCTIEIADSFETPDRALSLR